LNKILKNYSSLFLVAGLIILLDQVSKYLVRVNLPYAGDVWAPTPWIGQYARIVHWTNTGAAFGMFQGMSLVFTILAIGVSAGIIYFYPRVSAGEWMLRLAMGLELGGALGNLIDRLLFNGHVTDFISVGNFAVFNVADASISTGVVILIIGLLIHDEKDEKSLAIEPATAEESSRE
jgi:signal peptidase II